MPLASLVHVNPRLRVKTRVLASCQRASREAPQNYVGRFALARPGHWACRLGVGTTQRGETMRVERSLVALLASAALTAAGCHNNLFQGPDPKGCEQGRLAYNLPPAERLMEPGPGVGGPGPGVIPPMGGSGT